MLTGLIVSKLAEWGFSKLADIASMSGGLDFVKEKTGLDIAEMINSSSESAEKAAEIKIKLAELERDEQGIIYDYLKTVDEETTKRWDSDNKAGFLPKVVRPATLVYLLVSFTVMAFVDGTVINIPEIYSTGILNMLYIAVPAYFGLRTFEKNAGRAK